MKEYLCVVCGFSYDEALGLSERDIPPGTLWGQLPNDSECPHCRSPRSSFWLNETPQGLDGVIAALDAFHPENDGNDDRRLGVLLRGLNEEPERAKTMDSLFAVMERFPDADLGSPGPLVHTLEGMSGYPVKLRESLRRMPSELTVWMANRILNDDVDDLTRRVWLADLRQATQRMDVPPSVRSSAFEFLRHQAGRERE